MVLQILNKGVAYNLSKDPLKRVLQVRGETM